MDEKLENIINVSAMLFMKYGIRSISMDDIAREMGMSKKTLYLHVDNKTDLVKKILDYDLCRHFSEKGCCTAKGLNAIDILLEVSKEISKNFHDFNPSVNYDLQKYYPELYHDFIKKKRDALFIDIRKNIEQGIAEGIYRNDLNVDLIARLYLKKLEDIHDPDFMPTNQFTFKNIFEVMFESHIRGIANKKGISYLEKQKKIFNFNV
ncbi:MAG: TetR/AcrR family transcriptional regulator [Bacteroidia bacterium]|nr:TetR/AcrR family transcriptional regulator [Bacteroidia bacterium]